MRKYLLILTIVAAAFAISFAVSCDNSTTGAAPSRASNPSPANGATNVGVDADITWNGGSLALSGDAANYTYSVYFGTSASPPLVASDITATTYDPGTMDTATAYFWRIDTYNGSQTTTGDVWTFTSLTGGDEIIVGTRDGHINIPLCGG